MRYRDRIARRWRMLRWLFTGRCPACSQKRGHKMDCRLPEESRHLA